MADIAVRIVELEPMRVASARAVSASPERDAWEMLRTWAQPKGLLEDLNKHPVFGFNDPSPSERSAEYGYEFWIRVEPGVASEGGIQVQDKAGGLYAVTTCKLLNDPQGTVQQVWMKLWDWVQHNGYKMRPVHELEKLADPRAPEQELVLDLYLPIERS